MPVRYAPSGDHHDRDDYSFYIRDHGSRNFARSRRFVEEDGGEESRTMSLVSNPLQVPIVGRRSVSPARGQPSPHRQYEVDDRDHDWEDHQVRRRPQGRPRSMHTTVKERGYPYVYDDFPLQPLVPTYQPRRNSALYAERHHGNRSPDGRSADYYQEPDTHQRRTYDDRQVARDERRRTRNEGEMYYDEEEYDERSQQPPQQHHRRHQQQDHELQSILNWRKRPQEPLVHTDFGYEVPPIRRRADPSLQDVDDNYGAVTGYVAKRRQFAVENDDDMQYHRNPNYQYRMHGMDRPLVTDKDVEDSMERSKLDRAPMFEMKIRSHVVWEKMNVKFTCTVRGTPTPTVTWYKNMVPLEPSLHNPGKYKISKLFGLHTLEINRASIEDSGTYRVSLQNRKGEISCYATLLVRRYDGGKMGVVDLRSGYNMRKPTDYPDVEGLSVPGYPRFVTPLFGKTVKEGDAVIVTCEVEATPAPDVFWTLGGRAIDEKSSHIKQTFDGKQATLIILKVFTDDEGEYCCRAFNSCGAATSRCYLRVVGTESPPSAPCCVEAVESTRDYVTLSWKCPGYVGHFGGAPVDGYYIETCEAGSCVWRPWNRQPVKLMRSPVTGLEKGKVYFFRVKSLNKWGVSPPSLPSAAVALRDAGTPRLPEEFADPSTLIPPVIEEECEVEGQEEIKELPVAPYAINVTPNKSGSGIVITWKGSDTDSTADGYLIESKEEGSVDWKTETSLPLKVADPYPVAGLEPGKTYRFRVFAVNSAGCSPPLECAYSVTMKVKESRIDEQMNQEQDIADLDAVQQVAVDDPDGDQELGVDQQIEKSSEEDSVEKKDVSEDCLPADIEIKDEKVQKGILSKVPSAPVDVVEMKATREFIMIGWTPPFKTFGLDPAYYVEMSEIGTSEWMICNQSPIGLTHYPVVGLKLGCSYRFRVRAVTEHGTSSFSVPSDPIVASDGIKPPNWWGGVQGIFRVADEDGKPSVTRNSIKVCWDPPSTDGGSPVTGYYLECRPAGGKFKPVNNKPLNQRHFTVDGLESEVEYEFRIRACNIVGSGDWKVLPKRVMAKDPEPPNPPTDVLLTELHDEYVCLRWKSPKFKGDADMVGYIVERCKEGSDIWIPCNKLPEDAQHCKYKVDGLITGQTYFFRVRAVNRVGESEPSSSSCFSTPGEDWANVEERENAMLDSKRRKLDAELAIKRALEEQERREAFLDGIVDCAVDLGGRAYFEAIVKDPTTDVKWCLGNDKEIDLQPVSQYDIVHIGNKRSLIITNCQYEDIQLVHCIALYNDCTTSACCIVDGVVPVVFVERADDIYVDSGASVVFQYTLEKEDAKVTWYKNGVEIDADDSRYEIVDEGGKRSLAVKDSTVADSAVYTISGYGGSDKSHLVVDGVRPAYFSNSIHGGEYAHDEGVAEIECSVVPSDLYGDGEQPECIWYHNGDRLEAGDEKYEIIIEGNRRVLKILNLNHEDSGEIVCRCGGDEKRCDIEVERPPPPPPKLPELQQEDAAINFVQGLRSEALTGSMRLYCVLEKLREDVKIIWYKDDVELDVNGKEWKCLVDRDSGLVSLLFREPTAEMAAATYTCEFITSHSIFDTKVNFTFAAGEFEKVSKEAEKLQELEDKERRERLEDRRRKRAELRKKREEEEKSKRKTTPTAVNETRKQDELTCDGIAYGVDRTGQIVLTSQVSGMSGNADVSWTKNGSKLEGVRYLTSAVDDTVELTITEPTADDLGTYTCRIKSPNSSAEMSIDITGKVFDDLFAKSVEVREKLSEVKKVEEAADRVLSDVAVDSSDDDKDLVTVLRHENELIAQREDDDVDDDESLLSSDSD